VALTRIFTVTVERGRGDWWVLEAPDVGAVSRVRRLDQVEDEMREAIAHLAGLPESEVEVDVRATLPEDCVEHVGRGGVRGGLLDDPRAHAIATESGPSAILRHLIPLWREHGTVRTDWSAEEQAAALELLLIGYFAAQTRTISSGMAEDRAGVLGMSISAMLQASQPTKADRVPLANRVSDLLDEHARQLQNAQAEHRRD